MTKIRSPYQERSRVFWIAFAGGFFIGLNIGFASVITVQRLMGIIP